MEETSINNNIVEETLNQKSCEQENKEGEREEVVKNYQIGIKDSLLIGFLGSMISLLLTNPIKGLANFIYNLLTQGFSFLKEIDILKLCSVFVLEMGLIIVALIIGIFRIGKIFRENHK